MAPNRMTNASQQRCYFQETVVNEHLKISNCANFYVEFSKNTRKLNGLNSNFGSCLLYGAISFIGNDFPFKVMRVMEGHKKPLR